MNGNHPAYTSPHPTAPYDPLSAMADRRTLSHDEESYEYPHLSVVTFSDVFRQLDRASSPCRSQSPTASTSKKRRLLDVDGRSDDASISVALQQRLNRLANKKHKNEQEIVAPSTSNTTTTMSSSAQAYSPFSKSKLLERVATYQLTSYKVRLPAVASMVKSLRPFGSRDEESKMSEAVEALGRWIEPIGPALFGWTHLKPGQTFVPRHAPHDQVLGAKNKLVCRVCDSHWTVLVALSSDDDGQAALRNLLVTVQGLQHQHKRWCAWRKRQCDAQLYQLTGSTAAEGDAASPTSTFVGNLGTKKAQRVFAQAVQKVETVLVESQDVELQRPKLLAEDQLQRLSQVISLPETHRHRTPAILLVLLGWSPSSTSAQSSSSIIFSCAYCSRKISLPLRSSSPTSNKVKMINPEFEHRSFCPCVRGEGEGKGGRKYLWDLNVGAILSDADDGDGAEAESDVRQSMLKTLQNWQEGNSANNDTASTKSALAGWQASLATLLPSLASSNGSEDGSQDSTSATSTPYRDLRPSQAVKLLNGWFGSARS